MSIALVVDDEIDIPPGGATAVICEARQRIRYNKALNGNTRGNDTGETGGLNISCRD